MGSTSTVGSRGTLAPWTSRSSQRSGRLARPTLRCVDFSFFTLLLWLIMPRFDSPRVGGGHVAVTWAAAPSWRRRRRPPSRFFFF